MRKSKGSIGVAVVGCGSIGGLRAVLAGGHPAVDYLALYDLDPARARAMADKTNADLCAESLDEVLARDEVDAVIVSSTEEAHVGPVLAALRSGRPVLVEKPIAHDLSDAKDLVQASAAAGDKLYVGYTQRFRRKFLNGKEQILKGHLGELSGMSMKIYGTRAVARNIVRRSPHVNAVTDILTYAVDIMLWYFEGDRPESVYARSSAGSFGREHDVAENTWAVLQMASGAVVNLGVSWQLPGHHPASNSTIGIDVMGDEGFLTIDDGHSDFIITSDRELSDAYTGTPMHTAFVGTHAPADWAVGEPWGPIRSETYAFINTVATGEPHPVLTTARHAQNVLAITTAVNESSDAQGADREVAITLPED